MDDKARLIGERLANLVAGNILISNPAVGAKLLSLDPEQAPVIGDVDAVHVFDSKYRVALGQQLEALFTTELRDEPIREALGKLCAGGCDGKMTDLLVSSIIGFHAVTLPEDQQDIGPVMSALVEHRDYSGKLTTAQIGHAVDSINDPGLFTPDFTPEEIATGVIAIMSLTCRLAEMTESD